MDRIMGKPCIGDEDCKYQATPDGVIECVPGGNDCNIAIILEAEESCFHDSSLAAATAAIKTILANIPPDPNGRNLSFLKTKMGMLLAWVEHGGTPVEGSVTSAHDNATVAAALKLKL